METQNKGLNVGVKSFLTAIGVIAALMVLTFALTLFIPAGQYDRILDSAGNLVIDPHGVVT